MRHRALQRRGVWGGRRGRGARVLAVAATVAAGAAGAGGAGAQPEPQALPVEAVLAAMHEAYRAGPLAEDVLLKVRDRGGRGRTERYRVFVDAGRSRARLELGPLSVWLGEGRLVAAHAGGESRFVVEAPGAGPAALLALNLPPVPAPALDLALGSGAFDHPTPYSPGVAWASAVAAAPVRGAAVEVTLRGAWPGGEAEAVVGPESDRLRALTVWVGGEESPALTLEMRFTPAECGDPASWAIDTEGRRVAGSLSALEPPARPVVPGEPAPPLGLLSAGAEPWSLGAAVRALEGAPGAWLALVLYRDDGAGAGPGPNERGAMAAAEAARRCGDQLAQTPSAGAGGEGSALPEGLVVYAAGVFGPGAAGAERSKAAAERWRGAWPDGPGLLWTGGARGTIDRFDAEAAVLVVIVDSAGVVRAVERVDPAAAEPGAIGESLRRAIIEGR